MYIYRERERERKSENPVIPVNPVAAFTKRRATVTSQIL